MVIPQIKIPFELEIIETLKDGLKVINPKSRKLFKEKYFLQDRYSLNGDSFKIGDKIRVIVSVISKEDIKRDLLNKEFYCVINELTNKGFYTKSFDEKKFKRVFLYDARGLITLPYDFERFEIGDILKIEIKKL